MYHEPGFANECPSSGTSQRSRVVPNVPSRSLAVALAQILLATPFRALAQVGQNLHDHVVLLSLNTSKKSMAKEDYAEDGVHGLTYFSCPIPSGSAPASDDVSPSCSSSAVVGFTYMDGGGQAKDLPILVGMMMAKPGFLNAVLRTVMVMLCRVAVFLLPMDRMLGDRRSLLLLITTIKSRGTVRLASKDTRAHPLIDPGYLSHPQDQQTACACWQRLRQAKTETATGKEFFGEEILPGKRCASSLKRYWYGRSFC